MTQMQRRLLEIQSILNSILHRKDTGGSDDVTILFYSSYDGLALGVASEIDYETGDPIDPIPNPITVPKGTAITLPSVFVNAGHGSSTVNRWEIFKAEGEDLYAAGTEYTVTTNVLAVVAE